MRLGKDSEKKEQKKTNPYEVANKAVVWGRNAIAAAGGALILVKALPGILKDVVKK